MLSLSLSSPDDISAADRGSMEQSVSGFFFLFATVKPWPCVPSRARQSIDPLFSFSSPSSYAGARVFFFLLQLVKTSQHHSQWEEPASSHTH